MRTQYSISLISKILTNQTIDSDLLVDRLVFDSRKIFFPETSLFFALEGMRQDGHKYIPEAYRKGVRCFIVKFNKTVNGLKDSVFIEVENPINALQQIAAFHRSRYSKPVMAITGSNGKTIVKEWVYNLLSSKMNVVMSPGSFNSQIGVPLSVWQITEDHDLALIEAGVSKKGEMQKLANVIQPDIGIFTNLGDAHNFGFSDNKDKLNEKLKLFDSCHAIFCCEDYEFVVDTLRKKYPQKNIMTFSTDGRKQADMNLISLNSISSNKIEIEYIIDGLLRKMLFPYSDKVSLRLLFCAFLVAKHFIEDIEYLESRTEQLIYPKMRMEVEKGINDCILINDFYNSDFESILNSIEYINNMIEVKSKTLILSDFNGLSENNENLISTLTDKINNSGIGKIVLVGENISQLIKSIDHRINVFHYDNTDEFIRNIDSPSFQNEAILIKGSRAFQFEKIYKNLADSYHLTQLITDFESLDNNVDVYRSFLNQNTGIIAVLKASGYGAGSLRLAEHLQKKGIKYIAVAFMDEAIELRKYGISLPIMVFNPDLEYIEDIIKYDIEPVVYTLSQIEILNDLSVEGLKIHIKLDSGMKRLGFEYHEIDKLSQWLKLKTEFRVMSIFSHLAGSEDPYLDDFTVKQVSNYNMMFDKICQILTYRPLKHILNSSGVVRFPQYQFDMVRLGSGLHGVDISNEISSKLEPIHTLRTRISQIKILNSGEGVGYGLHFKQNKPRKIAILPIGYADGLPRLAGNGRYKVWIDGKFAHIVANISMDTCFIDITEIKDAKVGDNVEIFGNNSKIEDLASACETIFYEILCGISGRIKRVFTLGT